MINRRLVEGRLVLLHGYLNKLESYDLGDLREVARQIRAFVEGRGAP